MTRFPITMTGIIPARAGFTVRVPSFPSPPPDHPRSRGVYNTSSGGMTPMSGSSPLARGLLWEAAADAEHRRIIPARAGFTKMPSPLTASIYGSSPLARGLLHNYTERRAYDRIIPARAGFTIATASRFMLMVDHPRSRGVYIARTAIATASRGSSPLARGLRATDTCTRGSTRIIPARAGFTTNSTRATSTWGDHPRSRGVYSALSGARPWACGSSPLARGLLAAARRTSH